MKVNNIEENIYIFKIKLHKRIQPTKLEVVYYNIYEKIVR